MKPRESVKEIQSLTVWSVWSWTHDRFD